MLSLYEILKASKTGIAPDMWTALAGKNWGGADSGHEIKELTGIPPLTFRADGTPLLDYLISGNMSQSGTPTPTNPIQPSECGERTGNLFDEIYPDLEQGQSVKYKPIYVGDGDFTLSTDYPLVQAGTADLFLLSGNVSSGASTGANGVYFGQNRTFSSVGGYVTIGYRKYSATHPLLSDYHTMLNLGSTALTYEPYGIKIPISSGGENLFDKNAEYTSSPNTNKFTIKGLDPDKYYVCSTNFERIDQIYTASVYFGGGNSANNGVWKGLSRYFHPNASGEIDVYIRISPADGAPAIWDDVMNGDIWIMVNEGRTPLPYEPYIEPTETNIYLGEVQTTRNVKKLVLTGEENWKKSSVYQGSFYAQIVRGMLSENYIAYCTHLTFTTLSQYAKGKFCFNGDSIKNCNLWFNQFDNNTTVDELKTYLQQQYAAGTPVTVWYVLATETTGIVNEPLRKIGDYADTLSMEQAGVSIPTNKGNTVIDVETTLKPSEMYIKYKG